MTMARPYACNQPSHHIVRCSAREFVLLRQRMVKCSTLRRIVAPLWFL
jgi:hypothetical protein